MLPIRCRRLWPLLIALIYSTVNASDLGFNVGSKAASQIVSHGVHSALQQPRRVDLRLLSGEDPWFDPVAHIDAKARVLVEGLDVRFHDDLVDVEMSNLSVAMTSNVLLPLPFFLGEETAITNAELPHANVRLKVDDLKLSLDTCDIAPANVDVRLERSMLLNYLIKPFPQLVPGSLLRDAVCNALAEPLTTLRNKFALEVPLLTIVPVKFRPYLLHRNTSIICSLQSLRSVNEQLTVSANLDYGEMAIDEPSIAEASETSLSNIFEEISNESEKLNVEPPKIYDQETLYQTRIMLWLEDEIINEIIQKFIWNFEWMTERIPVNSTKLPRSTREFLAVLCTDCYFELKVSANGPPHFKTTNKTLVINKSERIFLKVVNPSNNQASVFISFSITLTVQVVPQIENGVFRSLVNLLDTSIKMEGGAFPRNWDAFVQDLVRDSIQDVIWPELKKELERLTYSDGVRLPISCGLEPTSSTLFFDDNRFGFSASLLLDELSASICIRQLRAKLPDPSKLLVIKDGS